MRSRIAVRAALVGGLPGALAWGWFEAGWVRFRTLEVGIPHLPEELHGLRVVHLSDFHLGFPSRGTRAVERAVRWTASRSPDLVLVTGDLLSRRSGRPLLLELLDQLPNCYAVLGNHDYALTRDPFAEETPLEELGSARLLRDEAETVELRGRRVQIAGVDPRSYRKGLARPARLSDPETDLRILLCHFPGVVDRLEPGAFDLVLAGHLHGGQICVPYGSGKLRLSNVRWNYAEGLFRRPAAALHVSRGLGTTFVPFRFFARPEATELRLVQSDA